MNGINHSNSKSIAYATFDKLFKPIFDSMCQDKFLEERKMRTRTKPGETKYHQPNKYVFKNTKDRLRIGFNGNQISEFTIAWYSVHYEGRDWTMYPKLKSETKKQNRPDIFERLDPIKDVARNYPIDDYIDKDDLSKQDRDRFKKQFMDDIINLHYQVEMYKNGTRHGESS